MKFTVQVWLKLTLYFTIKFTLQKFELRTKVEIYFVVTLKLYGLRSEGMYLGSSDEMSHAPSMLPTLTLNILEAF